MVLSVRSRGLIPGALALLTGALWATGCDREPSAPLPHTSAQTSAQALGDDPAIPGEALDALAPPTAAQLAPMILATGAKGSIPDALVIQSARPLVANVEPATALDASALSIAPPLEGSWSYRDALALQFKPTQGFAPSTRYTVTARALMVNTHTVRPDQPWELSFETPPFDLVSMGTPLSTKPGQAQVQLQFSAPLQSAELGELVSWSHKDKPISGARYRFGADRMSVIATLTAALAAGDALAMTLKPGVKSQRGDTLARGTSLSAALVDAPAMSVKSLSLREGSAGFHLDVTCDDDAAPGDKRWYWDNESYDSHYLSPRCVIDEGSLATHLLINPPVKLTATPSASGTRLYGDLKRGTYVVQLMPGLRTSDGGALSEPVTQTLTVSARAPQLNFSAQGRYMPRAAFKRAELRHLNQHAPITLTARHIAPQNLAFWLSGDEQAFNARASDVVAKRELQLEGVTDVQRTSWIDLAALVPEPKPGVYEIMASGAGPRHTSLRVVLTDFSLIAKRHAPPPDAPWGEQVQVWAVGMQDNAPKRGVGVELIRPSGAVMGRCDTDTSGACVITLPKPSETPDHTAPLALIARDGDALSYLKFDEVPTPVPTGAGAPYLERAPYLGLVYGDRDLYRPGDEAHFVGVVRTEHERAPQQALPVEALIYDPRGRVALRRMLTTNPAGLLSLDLTLPDDAATGRWQVALKVGKAQLAQLPFSVEEFVPERLRVKATTRQERYLRDEQVQVQVHASYLFGGSASGSKVELACRLEPDTFAPAKLGEYTFANDDAHVATKPMELGRVTGTLGAGDLALLSCPQPSAQARPTRTTRVVARASVFEAGSGRTTTRQASALVHPAPYYIGLKSDATEVQSGKPFTLEGLIVDLDGAPVDAVTQVQLELVGMTTESSWSYDDDHNSLAHMRRPTREGSFVAGVKQGKFSLTLTPQGSYDAYVVRAVGGDATTTLELESAWAGYARWYQSDGQTTQARKPGTIVLDAPARVSSGDKAVIAFDAPYRGRALLTLETHQVLSHQWMDVQAGVNQWETTITSDAPNVHATILLLKDPHLESPDAFSPARAVGATSIGVRPTTHEHQVRISAPSELRSEQTLKVHVQVEPAAPDTYVTIAVVDEGVLAMTDFKTPEPNAHLFAPRALGVATFDTVGMAVALASLQAVSQTGGGDEMMEKGMLADGSGGLSKPRAIKPVALWSGVVKLPADGKLELPLKLPMFRGALRVMAVSVSPTRSGHAQAEVLVRDPLTVQMTAPRVMTAGDEAQVSVFVSNLSDQRQRVELVLSVDEAEVEGLPLSDAPPLTLLSEPTQTIELERGASATARFTLKGMRQSGMARLRVVATASDLRSQEEALVPMTSAAARERVVTQIKVGDGTTDLRPYLRGWVPTSERTTFWLTPLPYAEAFDHLRYLVRYPYGCLEQTTSATLPLLHIASLLSLVDPKLLPEPDALDRMIRHGIQRVLSMQTGQGGFGYWPGQTTPEPWASAYATHMLLEARERGHEVPQERLDAALDWLSANTPRTSSARAEPYMHYVLAVAKRGQKARVQKLLSESKTPRPQTSASEHAEQLYLLRAAAHLLGDRSHEAALRAPDAAALTSERRLGGSYYSDLRRRGLMLNVYFDMFGKDAGGEALAQVVARGLSTRASYYYTTQELVWGVVGLGKWVQGVSGAGATAILSANGKPLSATKHKDRVDQSWALTRASEHEALELTVAGKTGGELYLIISSEGVREQPTLSSGGAGLSVKREHFDAEGAPLNLSDVKLGELIFSRVTLTNTTNEALQNLALVERLPAGWEVETPDLEAITPPQPIKKALWRYDAINVRDDRVEAFGTLNARASAVLIIPLRATTLGSFQAPAVSAEAMYDPALWARGAMTPVVVRDDLP